MRKALFEQAGIEEPSLAETPAQPGAAVATADSEIERLRDPEVQYSILNPDESDLIAELFVVRYVCDAEPEPHVTIADESPGRCPKCKSKSLVEHTSLDRHTYHLRLAFTERDIHRRKVFENIEHFAQMVFAEMKRYDPPAGEMDLEWLLAHRGYFEVGLSSPRTRNVLRDLLRFIRADEGWLVEGLGDEALMLAATQIMGVRQRRIEASQKKTPPPPAPGA